MAFVLSHHLVFLHTWGNAYGDALRRSGHGGPWNFTMLTVVLLTGALTVVGLRECVRLTGRVRELEGKCGAPRDEPTAALLRPMLRLWLALAASAIALFVLVENLEHFAVGAPLPGPSVLGSAEYNGPLPILVLVSLLVAVIGALFNWRRAVLLERIRATRPPRCPPDRRCLRCRRPRCTRPASRLPGRRRHLRPVEAQGSRLFWPSSPWSSPASWWPWPRRCSTSGARAGSAPESWT